MKGFKPTFRNIATCYTDTNQSGPKKLKGIQPFYTKLLTTALLYASATGGALAADTSLVFDKNRTAQYGYIINSSSSIDGGGMDMDISQVSLSELPIQTLNPGSDEFFSTISNFGTITKTDGEISGTGGVTGLGKAYYFFSVNNGSVLLDHTVFTNIETELHPFIFASGTVYVNESVVNGYTSHASTLYTNGVAEDGFVYLWTGSAYVSGSLFQNFSDTLVGAVVTSFAGQVLQITDSRFLNNSSVKYGGSIYWQNSDKSEQSITILNSVFKDNYSKLGGGVMYLRTGQENYYISDSVFTNNSTDGTGGAISIFNRENTTFTIRNSSFDGNEAIKLTKLGGGAIFFKNSAETDSNILNIIAEGGKNTEFSNNGTSIYVSQTSTRWADNDITVHDVTVNLNADIDSKVIFGDSIASIATNTKGEYLYDELNINKPDITYQYVYKADTASESETVRAVAPTGGEIVFNSDIFHMDVHSYGGTIALVGKAEAVADGELYENTRLSTSHLTIEAPTILKVQNESPIHEAAYSTRDEVALLALTQGAVLQRLTLGDKLVLNSNLSVQPAVNLETAASDKFTVGEGGVSGTGKIVVNGWIVTADKHSDTVVNVRLTDEGSALADCFTLDQTGGAIAYGPIYIWDVAYLGDSVYEFVRREPEPYFYQDHTSDDDEKSNLTNNSEKTESTDASGEAEKTSGIEGISDAKELLAKAADYTPSDFSPKDFNPDVYGQQVAALGVSVIQHAISESVFSESGVGSIDYLMQDEKPENKHWWGKVTGASLDLKTKNFHNIDMDFGVGMIGHQFDTVRTDSGDFLFGAYVGATTAGTRYSISKLRQNGAFVGGSMLYKKGYAWAGVHANIGMMSNHLKGLTDNKTSTPWLGIGTSVGYTFEFSAVLSAVTPMLDFSYVSIKAKDFTTTQGAEVNNSSLHSFEIAPGLRADKKFAKGWSAYVQARYAIVSRHDGSSSAGYTNESVHHLPGITNKNYAEYGLGVQKQGKNVGFGFNLNRNDGGREGWTGMARVSYRF